MEIKLNPDAARIVTEYADETGLTLMEAASELITAANLSARRDVGALNLTQSIGELQVRIEQILAYQRYILRHVLFVSVLLQRRFMEQEPDLAADVLQEIERQVEAYLTKHL